MWCEHTWILSVEADEPVDFGRGDGDKAGTDPSAVDVVHLGLERLAVGVLREPPERHVPDVPGLREAHPPRDRRVHAVAADHNLCAATVFIYVKRVKKKDLLISISRVPSGLFKQYLNISNSALLAL